MTSSFRWVGPGLCLLLFAAGVTRLRDYGSAYDSQYGFPQGEALLHRMLTGRSAFEDGERSRCPFRIVDFRDLPSRTDRFPIDHGQFPTTVGALSCLLLHQKAGLLGAIDAHNLPILFTSLGVLLLIHRFAVRLAGSQEAGIWAVLLCASHPRYVVDSFVNYKDQTVTFFLLAVALLCLSASSERQPTKILLAFAASGLGIASKVSMILGLSAISLWILLAGKARALWRWYGRLLLPGTGLVLLEVYAFWPFLQSPLPAGERVSVLAARLLTHGTTLTVAGTWRDSLLPAHALRYFLLASPELFLLSAAAGVCWTLRWCARGRREVGWLLIAIAGLFLGFFSLPGVFVTDGLRYVLPAIPCFAALGGAALAGLWTWLETDASPTRRSGIWALRLAFAAMLWVPVLSTHPYEISYFNLSGGGLKAAQDRRLPGAADYWGISYRVVVRWLNRHAAPDSLLVVPFAPHLVAINEELRSDIHLVRSDLAWCQLSPQTLYLFYATRQDRYASEPLLGLAEQQLEPIEVIRSQGAPVVKIFRETTTRLCELTREPSGDRR